MGIIDEYKKPENLRTLANYLRNHGPKSKTATQHDKRVEYFRGNRLMESLIENDEKPFTKWPKTLPKVSDKSDGKKICDLLIENNYFHRSEKATNVKSSKGVILKVSKINVYEETESSYYTWMYEGSMMWSNIGTILLITIVIGFTLLPIWPVFAKKGLWYIAVTFLITIIGFTLIRTILFMLIWITGYEFWILPNLWDESLAISDNFKPIYSFESSAEGQLYYRLGLSGTFIGFIFWVMTQPTEFDSFIQGQKSFIDDLYSGNLLSDVASTHKANLDKINNPMGSRKAIPSFEDLLRDDFIPSSRKESPENDLANDGSNNSNSNAPVDVDQMMEDTLQADADMEAMLEELTRQEEEEEAAEAAAAAQGEAGKDET